MLTNLLDGRYWHITDNLFPHFTVKAQKSTIKEKKAKHSRMHTAKCRETPSRFTRGKSNKIALY